MITIPTLADELFAGAHRHTSHTDRTESCRREYFDWMESFVTAGAGHVDQGDVDRLSSAYASWLAASGQCSSVLVTGPSGRNVRQAEKRNATERRRVIELEEMRKKLLRGAARSGKAAATAAAGGEAGQARTRLAKAEKRHAMMKAANAIVRSKPKNASTPKKIADLVALGMSDVTASSLFEKDWVGRYGFPGHELTSEKALVARLREKLVTLAALDAARDVEDEVLAFDGFAVELCWADDRLRVRFPRRQPKGDPRIAGLEGGGWRWSRTESAWQRKLTAEGTLSWSAINSVEEIFGVDIAAARRSPTEE